MVAVVREYRALDDTINMRLNRTTALMQDQERQKTQRGKMSVEEGACARVWQEMVGMCRIGSASLHCH